MVLGIVGIVFAFFCYPIGFVCAVVGLPLGGVAKSQIASGKASRDGNGQAVAGIVLCIISIAVAILAMVAFGNAVNELSQS